MSSIQHIGDVLHDNQGIAAISQVRLPSSSPDLSCSRLFLKGYLKSQVFTHTLPDINNLKNAIRQDIANVAQDTTSRHGKCTWKMAAMP
jgi:NADPH-dependent 7-cyano-7-deazaguanine reductase QueF-like protein